MKIFLVFAFTFIAIFSISPAMSKDVIKDKSPDGRFALRISKGEEGWEAAIVDLRTKEEVAGLEVYQNFFEETRLVWSKDSRRVAYFEPDRRGGTTSIFFRKGSKTATIAFDANRHASVQSVSDKKGD